jgi:hypothetical protein
MAILFRILEGIAISAFGLFLTLKAQVMIDFLGPMDWADQKFGGGGTRLVYKLVGIVITLVGFFVMTNLWDAFLQATLGSFFPSRPI